MTPYCAGAKKSGIGQCRDLAMTPPSYRGVGSKSRHGPFLEHFGKSDFQCRDLALPPKKDFFSGAESILFKIIDPFFDEF